MKIHDPDGLASVNEAAAEGDTAVCNAETNSNCSSPRKPTDQNYDPPQSDDVVEQAEIEMELGSKLLSRWYDGLFYPAKLIQVKVEEERGLVEFDDLSQHWVGVYDLQWPAQESDTEIKCSLCHLEHSNRPNQIVLCDGCGFGFHQQCHHPIVPKYVVTSEEKWYCTICHFASYADASQASRERLKAKTLTANMLPYNVKTLHWTQSHCSNVEQCYCYCGGSGQWYLKMLQCTRCKQWFHEACLSVRPAMPLTCGDTSYLFICSLCNDGPELLHRIDLRWVDIAHIALFNLAISNGKWSDFDLDIMPWINSRWDSLNVGVTLCDTPIGARFRNVLYILRCERDTFKNGSEIKKKKAIYSLRSRAPPLVPTLSLPPDKTVELSTIEDWQAMIITYPALSKHDVSVRNHEKPTKKQLCDLSDEVREQEKPRNKSKKTSEELSSANPVNTIIPGDPIPLKGNITNQDHSNNTVSPSANPSEDNAGFHGTAEDTPRTLPKKRKRVKHRFTLDKKIPLLTDYTGVNHPFLTAVEKETIKEKNIQLLERHRSREEIFDTFVKGLPGSDIMCDITNSPVSSPLVPTDTTSASTADNAVPKRQRKRKRFSQISSPAEESVGDMETTLPTLVSLGGKPDEDSLERCIYVGDALEHDEFQIRASRKNDCTRKQEYLVEWYEDMGIGVDTCASDIVSEVS